MSQTIPGGFYRNAAGDFVDANGEKVDKPSAADVKGTALEAKKEEKEAAK